MYWTSHINCSTCTHLRWPPLGAVLFPSPPPIRLKRQKQGQWNKSWWPKGDGWIMTRSEWILSEAEITQVGASEITYIQCTALLKSWHYVRHTHYNTPCLLNSLVRLVERWRAARKFAADLNPRNTILVVRIAGTTTHPILVQIEYKQD